MKNTILTFCCILLQQSLFAENKDWLIDGSPYKTEVNLSSDKKQIELTNGLLRRSFSLTLTCFFPSLRIKYPTHWII